MVDVNAICNCGKDMMVEPSGDFIRLVCSCGQHKMFRIKKLGPKDTQPVPVIARSMTEAEISEARRKLFE